jgi:hypothetical protein
MKTSFAKNCLRRLASVALGLFVLAGGLTSCASSSQRREVIVSVADQKMALREDGKTVRVYDCSTSKYGVGDRNGSYATPEGKMAVVKKIGGGTFPGTVFKGRRPNGEILPPNAPGRDPIVTRILWLAGKESRNSGAYSRCIYIHGTPEECRIGSPASYGCVRMRSMDVIDLYNRVPVGTQVTVTRSGLPMDAKFKQTYVSAPFPMSTYHAIVGHPSVETQNSRVVASVSSKRMGPPVSRTSRASKKTLR